MLLFMWQHNARMGAMKGNIKRYNGNIETFDFKTKKDLDNDMSQKLTRCPMKFKHITKWLRLLLEVVMRRRVRKRSRR